MITNPNWHVYWKQIIPKDCVWKELWQDFMKTKLQGKQITHCITTIWYTNLFPCFKRWCVDTRYHRRNTVTFEASRWCCILSHYVERFIVESVRWDPSHLEDTRATMTQVFGRIMSATGHMKWRDASFVGLRVSLFRFLSFSLVVSEASMTEFVSDVCIDALIVQFQWTVFVSSRFQCRSSDHMHAMHG